MQQDDLLEIGGKTFGSRLIVGTGKYAGMELMQQCHEASGADMVTVALRRMELPDSKQTLLDYIDRDRFTILPNTAGCYDAESAILTARLAREAGLSDFVKLEVIGDQKTLFPDVVDLLEATRVLAKEGFIVMPYTNDDPVMAKKLEDAGAAVVMPLGAPIGSGLGICNPYTIRLIMEAVQVPVIVDAGRGHGVRRHGGHGARRGRCADEHRHRRRQGPPGHGPRHAHVRGSGPAGVQGRTDRTQALRHRQQPPGGRHWHLKRRLPVSASTW